jgi:hypothetical protein
MAMRLAAFSLILTAGLALAGAASAQMMGQMGQGMMMGTMPSANATYGGDLNQPGVPTAQQRYAARIMALKQKMAKLTQQDGGQLSDEHKASLQRELDGVNKSFGIKPAHG